MSPNRWRLVSLGFIAIGFALSFYLLLLHFRLLATEGAVQRDLCSALFGGGCSDALMSNWSRFLGLPLAGWGVLYFGFLGALLLLSLFIGPGFGFEAALAGFLITLVGLAGSLTLTGVMLFTETPTCALCLLVHLVNLLLVPAFWGMVAADRGRIPGALAGGMRFVTGAKVTNEAEARWKSLGFVCSALVALALYQWVYVQETVVMAKLQQDLEARSPAEIQARLAAEFEATPVEEVGVTAADPAFGPEDAPVELVVFSDFECPACRGFAQALPGVLDHHEQDVRVVYKHFPLDPECNPVMENELHPMACEAARAAEAARLQGRFWQYHDQLFAHEADLDAATLEAMAREAGLDVERWRRDLESESVAAGVSEDVERGVALEVMSTPTVFVNGKRLKSVDPNRVHLVIETALSNVAKAEGLPAASHGGGEGASPEKIPGTAGGAAEVHPPTGHP